MRLNSLAIGLALAAAAVYGLARALRQRENEPENDGAVPRQACPGCGEDWRQLPIAGACPGCQMPYDETTMVWGERDFEGLYLRFVLVGPADMRIRTRQGTTVIPLDQIRNISVDASAAVELKTGEQVSMIGALPDWRQARHVREEALARAAVRGPKQGVGDDSTPR